MKSCFKNAFVLDGSKHFSLPTTHFTGRPFSGVYFSAEQPESLQLDSFQLIRAKKKSNNSAKGLSTVRSVKQCSAFNQHLARRIPETYRADLTLRKDYLFVLPTSCFVTHFSSLSPLPPTALPTTHPLCQPTSLPRGSPEE